jgi:SAM-dependent methyltransferase
MENNSRESLKETYNKYAHIREKNEIQPWKVENRRKFLEIVKKEDKTSLLEIGAGIGRDSKFFMDNGLKVKSTDLSSEMIALCKEKGIEAFELDFYNLHILEERFDCIWAMNCLLHVEKINLPLILKEISGVLKLSGLFFMGVYGGEDSEGIWEEDIYTPHRFFSFYTDETINEVVTKCFDIVNFERIETGGKYHFQSIVLRKR